jgi:hypothetical protein
MLGFQTNYFNSMMGYYHGMNVMKTPLLINSPDKTVAFKNNNNSRLLFWAKSGTKSSQFNPTVLQ